jgi:uncharacterized protein (DUF488 family)
VTGAYSVGHGTASPQQFLARLAPARIRRVVDIRTAPGSRRHPHFARAELMEWLPAAGVAYRWDRRLGGLRRPAPGSPDTLWQNDSFRAYAAHLRTEEAREALADLLADAAAEPTAFMCAETLWWRCHRRLVADVLVVVHALPVAHLMPGRIASHPPTEGARRVGDSLVYDGRAS